MTRLPGSLPIRGLATATLILLAAGASADPTTVVLDASEDAYVREARFGNTSGSGTVSGTDDVFAFGDLRFGCDATTVSATSSVGCSETFVRFPISPELASALDGATIESATLTLTVDQQPPETGELYTLAPVTGSWTESTLTWNTRPPVDLAYRSDFTAPLASPLAFDVTDVVAAWADGTLPIEGFSLFGASSSLAVFGTNAQLEAELRSTDQPPPAELTIVYTPPDGLIQLVPTHDNLVRLEIGGPVESPPSVLSQTFQNFSATHLQVGCTAGFAGGVGTTRCNWSLLLFDLPPIEPQDLIAATLVLEPNAFPVALDDTYFVDAADSAWNPATVSWADRPGIAAASTGGVTFAPPTTGPVELDVTGLVAQWIDGTVANEGFVLGNVLDAFALFPASYDGVLQTFGSEVVGGTAADSPRLEICVVPEPGAGPLAAAAVAALLLLRRSSRHPGPRRSC